MKNFTGKSAVITGATGGIGFAIADAMSKAGAELHLLGRNRPMLEEVADKLVARYGTATTIHIVDFHRSDGLAAQLEDLTDLPIDFLVHSAGSIFIANVSESDAVRDLRLLEVNYHAPVELTRLLLGPIRRVGGAIVFINSSVSRQSGKPGLSAYSASKYALRAFSECLRAEENKNGIRILNVYPGRTASAMQEKIHELEGKAYDGDRLLQPQDVASMVIHALSLPDSAEVTDLEIRPFRKS